ncbi:hypothetical protein [Paractinoplanes atraurantiacus]|uniref:Excreted virulence factor EspC, type VII ESX diderm n=1 Tax=Paractinoplanes atraurantiacus TaxID=1036182 RepID=A0A285JED1_9ACTN|nr:hypothetical protein [Actinoplanes atraurantiacus]SNY58622.1 hypothetical protein SAMN05421748_119146 [Actinoplanes atraurantiacus]
MNDQRLRLDPDDTLEGSRSLTAAGEDLTARRNHAGAEIAAATAASPWGRDEYGRSFERQYHPVEQQVLDAWRLIAAHVTDLGEAVAQSVHDNLATDADNAGRLRLHRSRS